MPKLTEAGEAVVLSWQQVNAQILTTALTRLPRASRATVARALPAMSELTAAVDALADEMPAES